MGRKGGRNGFRCFSLGVKLFMECSNLISLPFYVHCDTPLCDLVIYYAIMKGQVKRDKVLN